MRYWIIATGVFVTMLGVLACASVLDVSPGAESRATGPQFDHAAHISRGVECADCHGAEPEQFNRMPELDSCTECHNDIDGEKPPEKRAAAFYDADKKGKWTHASKLDRELVFPHAQHVTALGKDCTACHGDVAESKTSTGFAPLTMGACMSCHEQKAPGKNDCAVCHTQIRRDVAPKSHRLGWKREHGRKFSEGDMEPLPVDCSVCHKKSDCDTCHRAEAPQNHTNLWRLHGHAAAASLDREGCRVCHTTDSCFQCHENTKPRNHTATWGSPFDRHCNSCHLPVEGFDDQGCAVCHKGSPGHASAPMKPGNAPHLTTNPANCRECHVVMRHPDNGQSCLLCHR